MFWLVKNLVKSQQRLEICILHFGTSKFVADVQRYYLKN